MRLFMQILKKKPFHHYGTTSNTIGYLKDIDASSGDTLSIIIDSTDPDSGIDSVTPIYNWQTSSDSILGPKLEHHQLIH